MNPRLRPWQGRTLPLSYSRKVGAGIDNRTRRVKSPALQRVVSGGAVTTSRVMPKTWFVVASRAGARILERKGRLAELSLVETLQNEAGRLKSSEIDTDRAGRSFDAVGHGRHPMEREESPHDRAAANFARELAERVLAGRNTHRFDQLVLVAEPRFLGLLRAALDHVSAGLVIESVGKDFAHLQVRDLEKHLMKMRTSSYPALKAS